MGQPGINNPLFGSHVGSFFTNGVEKAQIFTLLTVFYRYTPTPRSDVSHQPCWTQVKYHNMHGGFGLGTAIPKQI